MLLDILSGKCKTKFILIEDTKDFSGRALLLCSIKTFLNRNKSVHILCLEQRFVPTLQKTYESYLSDKLFIHQLHNFKNTSDSKQLSYEDFISCRTTNFLKDVLKNQDAALVIDGLSFMLVSCGVGKTCEFLHSLTATSSTLANSISCVLGLIHSDVHEAQILSAIEYFSSSTIKLSLKAANNETDFSAKILHKSEYGKVSLVKSECRINFDSLDLQENVKDEVEAVETSNNKSEIMTLSSQVPFSLTLKDSEIKSRSELVLPYTRKQIKPEVETNRIVYSPDFDDDDDPDDDLDF